MSENDALTYDQLKVGDQWVSPARTVTETDVVNFACLTGDHDPLHMNHEHAKESPFGRPIAHGLLGLSFVAGLGVHSPRAATVAFVQIREWKFLQPIFFGDTVHVVNEIIEKEASGRRRGKVIWKRSLLNQNAEIVQEGILETVVEMGRAPKDK